MANNISMGANSLNQIKFTKLGETVLNNTVTASNQRLVFKTDNSAIYDIVCLRINGFLTINATPTDADSARFIKFYIGEATGSGDPFTLIDYRRDESGDFKINSTFCFMQTLYYPYATNTVDAYHYPMFIFDTDYPPKFSSFSSVQFSTQYSYKRYKYDVTSIIANLTFSVYGINMFD